MSRDDALDLALQALEELGEGDEPSETQYAFNAINAFTPDAELAPKSTAASIGPESPDPGARCVRHRRLLTFSEQLFGACSWCMWEARRSDTRRET